MVRSVTDGTNLSETTLMIDYRAVLEHYHRPVPRYTSYPTAPQFKPGVGAKLFAQSLDRLDPSKPVSAYIHIPFCDRLCWFCACHTKHTLKYEPIASYMQSLAQEFQLFAARMDFRPQLGQLHLGGGSPSLLRGDELALLRDSLETAFEFSSDTEISVEIDPCDVDEGTISGLLELGLSRASIGVQDFHPDVQAAINRPQGFEITRDVVRQLRDAGIRSINIDALYGLPLQTEERLVRTIEQCISLQPDRMALFGYAHVPWLKKHQKLIRTEDLAGPYERFEHSQTAAGLLTSAGYDAIGIDHFALPQDALATAARTGTMHRNFQGYTTDSHETMIGFGASSIGRFADSYIQNTVPAHKYQKDVASGILPKDNGLQLTAEDRLRGHVIERLMCDFSIDFSSLGEFTPNLVNDCFEQAQAFLTEDLFDLCSLDGTTFSVRSQARPFARIIAAQFDAYYQPERFRYSKAV